MPVGTALAAAVGVALAAGTGPTSTPEVWTAIAASGVERGLGGSRLDRRIGWPKVTLSTVGASSTAEAASGSTRRTTSASTSMAGLGAITNTTPPGRTKAVLPGARVRRLLFWRYILDWDRPTT